MIFRAGMLLAALQIALAPPVARATPGAVPLGEEPPLITSIDLWAASVGGWPALANLGGVQLRERTVQSGIAGIAETRVTRDALHMVCIECPDGKERLRQGVSCWDRDWNGKTLALQGRDLRDAVTEAFLRSLVYAGFSRETLRQAMARDAGEDSTHALAILELTPSGGIPCRVELDKKSGRPVRAVRRPYDDDLTLAFDDWRDVAGVAMPYRMIASSGRGDLDTSVVMDVTPFGPGHVPQFAPLTEGPSDATFERGDSAVGIPFNFENDHILVQCRVDGSKPMWFIFDTGADQTVIHRARLSDLGLTAFGAGKTAGGGGTAELAFTRVGRLEVGGVALSNQRDGVLDMTGLERLYGMPLGGILGYDFASRFTVVCDYGTKTMSLYAPGTRPGTPPGTRVPIVLEQRVPHVQGEVAVDDGPRIPADFVIDSGAAETANLTSAFVRAHGLLERARKTPPGEPNVTPGLEKQWFTQTSVRGRLRAIRLGEIEVRDVPINLQLGTTGSYASTSFSGTIGERILRRFTTTYDYDGSALYLDPNAESTKPFLDRTTYGLSLVADGSDFRKFTVAGVRKDSPAEADGFRKGDVIAAFDGKKAGAWRLADLRAALAADASDHTVQLVRGTQSQRLLFRVRLVSIED